MNAQTWRRLASPLIERGWRCAGNLAYVTSAKWVLRGVLGEQSASSDGVYIWRIRLPLYVPTDDVDLSWSERLGGPSQTFAAEPAVLAPLLMRTAADVEVEASERGDEALVSPVGGAENVRMQEAHAYGLLLDGNAGGAREGLTRVTRYHATYPWERELVDRATMMRTLIDDGRPEDAVRKLGIWRKDTIAALKLQLTE